MAWSASARSFTCPGSLKIIIRVGETRLRSIDHTHVPDIRISSGQRRGRETCGAGADLVADEFGRGDVVKIDLVTGEGHSRNGLPGQLWSQCIKHRAGRRGAARGNGDRFRQGLRRGGLEIIVRVRQPRLASIHHADVPDVVVARRQRRGRETCRAGADLVADEFGRGDIVKIEARPANSWVDCF